MEVFVFVEFLLQPEFISILTRQIPVWIVLRPPSVITDPNVLVTFVKT